MDTSNKKYLLIDLTVFSSFNTTERNAYSFYVSLLLKKNNNIIYNASNKKLSELTKIHRNSITKYLEILTTFGYIEFKGNNLHLKSFDERTLLYKFYLYRSLSAFNVKTILENEVIKLHLNRQKYAIKFKTDLRSRNKMTIKRIKKNVEFLHGDFNKEVLFSYRYGAMKLGVSIGKIQNVLRYAKDKGFLKTNFRYEFLTKVANFNDFIFLKKMINKQSNRYTNLKYSNLKVYQLMGTELIYR